MKPRVAIPVPHTDSEYAGRALPQYLHALEEAGAEPVVVDLGLSNQEIARIATGCQAILLPGSRADIDPQKYGVLERHPQTAASDPRRDNADELLIQDAFNLHKPILGVCYGMQSLNVWRTGSLIQHVESPINHRAERTVTQAHAVTVEPESRLATILGPAANGEKLWVNSSHHQAADAVGDGLRAVAWAEDGVIEAIEGTSPGQFVLAVQWHPERTFDGEPSSRAIFRAFVEAAKESRIRQVKCFG
ncbi:MAG: gamma-glutamyl-gamma-aminobutyrate hydrolase family protein [Candidatus Korobacteraceae bacterium]